MQASRVRPTGITILVVLEAIVSTLLVLGGLVLVVLGPLLGIALPEIIQRPMPMGIPGMMLAAFIVIVGIFILILGIGGFVIAWGLWTGRGWAWTLALVLAVINIILDLFRLNIIGLFLNGLIAYYLWQPHVKAFYGKEAVQLPYQVTVTKTQAQPPQPQPGTAVYCSKCGTANPVDSRFCHNCGAEIKA